tara:strand:- start:269 stop:457 length:189 start_codon:yes stop_codon:yes gene_type:complete
MINDTAMMSEVRETEMEKVEGGIIPWLALYGLGLAATGLGFSIGNGIWGMVIQSDGPRTARK